jgi:hypothetical protein
LQVYKDGSAKIEKLIYVKKKTHKDEKGLGLAEES